MLVALQDKNPHVRRYAAAGLAIVGGPEAVSALEATLRAERSPHALSGLLSALYLLGQDSRLERLLQLLGHSDPQVRDQVISGLEFGVRQNERQQVINAIKDLLEGESHPSVRHNGEKLLAKLQLDQSKLNNDVEPTA